MASTIQGRIRELEELRDQYAANEQRLEAALAEASNDLQSLQQQNSAAVQTAEDELIALTQGLQQSLRDQHSLDERVGQVDLEVAQLAEQRARVASERDRLLRDAEAAREQIGLQEILQTEHRSQQKKLHAAWEEKAVERNRLKSEIAESESWRALKTHEVTSARMQLRRVTGLEWAEEELQQRGRRQALHEAFFRWRHGVAAPAAGHPNDVVRAGEWLEQSGSRALVHTSFQQWACAPPSHPSSSSRAAAFPEDDHSWHARHADSEEGETWHCWAVGTILRMRDMRVLHAVLRGWQMEAVSLRMCRLGAEELDRRRRQHIAGASLRQLALHGRCRRRLILLVKQQELRLLVAVWSAMLQAAEGRCAARKLARQHHEETWRVLLPAVWASMAAWAAGSAVGQLWTITDEDVAYAATALAAKASKSAGKSRLFFDAWHAAAQHMSTSRKGPQVLLRHRASVLLLRWQGWSMWSLAARRLQVSASAFASHCKDVARRALGFWASHGRRLATERRTCRTVCQRTLLTLLRAAFAHWSSALHMGLHQQCRHLRSSLRHLREAAVNSRADLEKLQEAHRAAELSRLSLVDELHARTAEVAATSVELVEAQGINASLNQSMQKEEDGIAAARQEVEELRNEVQVLECRQALKRGAAELSLDEAVFTASDLRREILHEEQAAHAESAQGGEEEMAAARAQQELDDMHLSGAARLRERSQELEKISSEAGRARQCLQDLQETLKMRRSLFEKQELRFAERRAEHRESESPPGSHCGSGSAS